MNKIVQFLLSNVLIVIWNFFIKGMAKLKKKMDYESDKKTIAKAEKDLEDKKLRYRANKSLEDVLNKK